MAIFADLLADAFAKQPTRGQVFWVANQTWSLPLYQGAKFWRHPGLVCDAKPTLAPGTSDARAGRRTYGEAFSLEQPDALNGNRSTFFLAFRKFVPSSKFDGYLGLLQDVDLRRLDRLLGPESEQKHGAN